MIKKALSVEMINNMTKEEYIQTILDFDADNLDHQIENQVLVDLVNKFVNVSKQLEEKIKEVELISITDPLTKTFNRLKFNQAISDEFERYHRYNEKFSIILLDIDHFKDVNDNYGHDIGDETLVKLTQLVSEMLRKNDMFARWGGEEFIILVVNSDIDIVYNLAQRIREKIEKTQFKKVSQITISLGVSTVNKHDTIATIIKRADNALYEAKNTGRNKVVLQKALE